MEKHIKIVCFAEGNYSTSWNAVHVVKIYKGFDLEIEGYEIEILKNACNENTPIKKQRWHFFILSRCEGDYQNPPYYGVLKYGLLPKII